MNRRAIFVISGVALIAILVAYFFLLFQPLQTRINEHDTQIKTERDQLVAAQAKLAQFSTFKDEATRNQGRLLELAKLVPESAEVPSLLLDIQDLATEAGITFLTVTPGAASAAAGFQQIPLQLQFEGSFFDVNDFIYRAEQLASGPGRLLSVQTLGLALAADTAGPVSSPRLTVSMTMNAFQRNPDLEPAAAAAPAKAATPATGD